MALHMTDNYAAFAGRVLRHSFAYPWVADQRDGTFCNPVLYADYPDPDVVRDGSDYYMTVSSFHCTPALPILRSRDLVNWTIINHALEKLPHPRFDAVHPGCGVWAPSIRKHAGLFWIFFAMPDEGMYCTTARHPADSWSAPHLVQEGKGLIDPCPLWDDDGNAYLVHAYAGSRAGIKHRLRVRPMAADGSKLLGEGHIAFDDPLGHPTLEGPKFHKRDGYYYILAPAGGVETGWQLALRSRHIYGPYQEKVILEQGSTSINGPHQGALVDTPAGQWWFVHFQDAKLYGRIPHLQPARWENGWPHIGIDLDHNGIGEPVARHRKPLGGEGRPCGPASVGDAHGHILAADASLTAPQTSDDFDPPQFGAPRLGPQWHWNANHYSNWFSLTAREGWLRLYAQSVSTPLDLVLVPSVLLQKFPARSFVVETRVDFSSANAFPCAGLAVIGKQYAALALRASERGGDSAELELVCLVNGSVAAVVRVPRVPVSLRIGVSGGGRCSFSYHTDASPPHRLPVQFEAVEGVWVGAKIGLFAVQMPSPAKASDSPLEPSFADFDYLRFRSAGLKDTPGSLGII
jgi:beta-xylosidase